MYAAAFERVPYPDLEAMKLGITQVSETNPKVRGVDPREFVDGRLLREIEASGYVKRLYGEREVAVVSEEDIHHEGTKDTKG